MASREMVAISYAFLALAVCPTIFSAPAPKQTCAPVCTPGRQSSVLKYEEGKTYIYNFETEVVTQLVGSTDETSRIKVKGQAAVAAQSACDLVLTVQQIAITSSSGQAISRVSDIEGSSIRFAYTDGVVDSVCVSDDDPSWSANIKRAIVSMLGNKAINGDTETIETDVNGECKTLYQVSGSKYTKTKDLQGCTHRDGGMANAFGVPYTAPSQYHAIPLFNSVLSCTQELGKGVIQSVECNEGHSLEVVQSSGVRTDIKSTLNLANVQAGIVKGSHETNKKSCLLYDFGEVDDGQKQKAAASNAVDLLNKLCTEIESGTVSLKVPGIFLQLRKQVRHARKDDLKLMDEQITSGKLCPKAKAQLRKLLLDASAMSAGDGPISFLAEVIANEEVQDTTKDLFIAYTAFAEHPGPNALEGVNTLISKPDSEPEYLLAASGLAHQYCRLANPDCGSNEQYQSVVNTIAQRISVATEEEQIEKVIVALQALGNVDSLTPAAVTALVNLIDDSNTNQRLKVRALDASRRDPCQETLKKKTAKIFSDIKESSQVRIQAYLTLTRCLTPEDVPVIEAVANNEEESNQVGAFVLSHVTNALESTNPDRVAQRKVYELIQLREFPSDLRKFSRNYEISAYNPTLMNSGLSLDTNVIFSQDSYIPRCSNSNFTVAAFGRSYNLLELGLCIEDFEDVVERLLGPTSKIRTTTLDDIVRESADKISKLKSGISNRFKRDVAVSVSENEIDAIRNEVDIRERTGNNGNGDIYVRILGTSILVESFSQDGMRRQPLIARIQRAIENLREGVKEQNVDVTEPFMFMDDEIIIPTSSGLPLTVTTEGTSVLSLQITGNLDVASLLRGDNGDMKARIMPSAATVVRARMVLGSGPIESGLQVEGKIHSAAGVDLKVVRENRKLELRVNIPQERIQLVDIRSDIYWIEQSMDQLEKKTPMKTKLASRSIIDNQCSSSLTKVVGLKVCADVKVPQVSTAAPLFFLNGPSVISLSIEKIEQSMEGYYLKVETLNDDNTYGLDLVLDTPGSRTNRKISATARAIAPRSDTPQYSLKIESPLNNVELNYKRSFTDALVGAELSVKIDGDAYSGIAQVSKTPEGSGYKLVPLVQYQLPNGNPVKLVEGEITRVPGQKLNVNVRTGGPLRILRGNIKGTAIVNQNENDQVDIEYKDLEFASEVLGKVLIDGSYKRQGKLVDLKVNSKYGQDAQHTLTLDATVGNRAPGDSVLKVSTRSSRRELLNFDLDWSLKRGDGRLEHNLQYTRGLTDPKVIITQKSVVHFVSKREFEVDSELTIKHPAYNIDFHAEAEAKSVPGQERHAKLEARLGENLQAKATYEGSGALLSNYKILGNVVLGEKTYEISEVATKVNDNKRNYKSRISVQPGFYYEANTDVYLKFEKGDFKSELSTEITSDQLDHPILLKSTVAAKADGYGALLKLDAQGKTYVDFQTTHQVTRSAGSPTSYATKMKAHVLNIIDAKLSNTYSNGNGDLVLDALLAKSGRKIAGTSKVQRNGDTYDLKADLKWDAERDPSKAITLKSTTTLAYSELRIDSKNDITVIGKSAKVNMRGSASRDLLNGESTAEIDYTSPSGKTYSATSKLDLENRGKIRAGKVSLHVAPPDVQPSDIEAGIRVSNIDKQDRTFDIKADLKANYRNEKDLTIHGELSSSIPGNYRSYAGRLSAEGSAIPKPLSVSLKTDLKSGRIAVKGESISPVKSSLDATIDYDYWSPKKTVGLKYAITTPIDRIQSLEGEIQAAYLKNSWKNFEVSNSLSLTLNGGSPYSSSYLLSVLENEAKYSHKFVAEGKPIVTVTAEGKYDRRHVRANLNADVKGAISKLNLDVEHQLPNIAIVLKGETTAVDALQNFEVKITNKKNADGTLDTEILARADDEDKLVVRNKLENTPTRKSIDAQIIVGDETPRKLFLLFNEEQRGKWNVEALAKWGEGGKYISTKGSLTRLDGAFEGELSLDSPHFQANKYSVRVAKTLTDGKHGVDISVDGNNKKQLAITLTYAAKSDSSYERSFEGTLKVEGQAVGKPIDFNGKFRLDDTTLDRQRDNGEEGRRIRAAIEINTDKQLKVNLLAKRSNKENRLQLSLCKDTDGQCSVGNVQFKHTRGENGDLEYELRITADKVVGEATTETYGVVFQSRFDRSSRQFEHLGKLIIGQEKTEQIGYRVYCSPDDKEIGGEILLPARVIALVVSGDRTSAGAYNGEVAFYIDKTKKADRKISLVLSVGERAITDDNASGRTLAVILRHPDLNKDLKIQTRYAIGGDATIIKLETILDVLQAGSEIVATYSLSKEAVAEGRGYNSVLSVVSSGLHINFEANGELKYANRALSYKNVISYENRDGQVKTSQVVLGISKQRCSLEIDGPDSRKIVSLISTYESLPTGGEIRYEIFLPGMSDTRIVKAIAHTERPRNVQLKITTSSNTNDQYVEAFLGFRSEDELAAGVYDHQTDGRHVLGDVTFAMNGTRILSVKSDWNKENAQAVLTRVQQRGERHIEQLRVLLSEAIEEVAQEARHITSNVRNAAPDLSVVVTGSRQQLKELNQELKQNEDTKLILQRLNMGAAYLRQFTRIVLELARTARRIAFAYIGGLRESLSNLPEKYSQILEKLPEQIEKLKLLVTRGVEALIAGSRVAAKVLLEAAERLYEALPPFADAWNWIVDNTEGIVQVLSELAQKVAEKLAKVYAGLKSLAERIMTNKTLQALLSELRNRMQILLEEFIEDTKEHLETIKNYILNAVPQKEFQEFIEALIDYLQKKAEKVAVDDGAALRNIYEKLRATVKKVVAEIFTLDFSRGIFRAQIPLPVSLNSLSEFSKVFTLPSRPKINFRIPSYTYGLRELINQIRSGAAINEILPPFKGYALIIGSKHYKTFDGRFFEFEGNCQYLLASDFDDKNFTVVADYDRQGDVSQKSIIVTDHHDTVALKPDHSVAVNGQTVEIDNAKTAGSLLIERIGNWVIVRNKGSIVGCSVTEDVCAVKVDGFYHGKVLGLLGTMNLERFDDLRKPNGEITPSIEQFASSWKLDKQCAEPTIMTTMIQATQSAEEKCRGALDNKRSSLRPCYGVVDPTPYRNVCEKLSQKPGYTEEQAVCTASVGYAKACYLSYAKVDSAPACAAA